MTDQGTDPRQVIADAIAANEAEAAAIAAQQARESLTVAEAWQAYVAERSASMKDGKPEWGEKHKAHHHYFVQSGGVKRKRETRTGEPRIQHVKANLAAAVPFPRCPCMVYAVPLARCRNGWKSLPVSWRRLWDTSRVR